MLNNQRGLTLIELLAVIVIIAIIALIAVPSVGKIISNSKADAHIANARTVINAAKLAYASGSMPKEDWYDVKAYRVKNLVEEGLLDSKIKNPTILSGYEGAGEVYDLDNSLVIYDPNSRVYKVNLSVGGQQYIFNEPKKLEELQREALLPAFK